ncbi:hypothetical protein [Ferrimonas balearica]|uniref:hypothetical protein n=1 Tax=Ferrimonas balearica TaxID=44012 RepID=UPI001F37E76C|nr:hypothetical protein [Ferrimonas balearica]MBY6094678.1 hypothetical protein [Ferrimonas balearica]
MSKALLRYLENIQNDKPVNWPKVVPLLSGQLPSGTRLTDVVVLEKAGKKDLYRVRFKDGELLTDLLDRYRQGKTGRVGAALAGNSHRHKVSFGGLPIMDLSTGQYGLMVCAAKAVVQDPAAGHQALVLIENKELFYQPVVVLRELLALTGCRSEDALLVLGNGKEVTNSYFRHWFDGFSRIDCLFDYDQAGLAMYDTLRRRHGAKLHFAMPSNLGEKAELFSLKPEKDEFAYALRLCEQYGFDDLATVFRHTSRFMEQETLLTLLDTYHV